MKISFRYATTEDEKYFNNLLIDNLKERTFLGFTGYNEPTFQSNAHKACLVAVLEDLLHKEQLLGFTVAYQSDWAGFNYIGETYVVPKFRRKGIGTKLVQEAEKYCAQNWQAAGVEVETNDNKPMEALLKKQGFKISGHFKKTRIRDGRFSGRTRWIKIYK